MSKLVEVARFTSDVAATSAFYEQLLGIKPPVQSRGLSEFHLGDVVLRIHETHQATGDEPFPEDHIAFAVDSVESAFREALSVGLCVETPPRYYDWGKSAYLRDPDGRLVELHKLPTK